MKKIYGMRNCNCGCRGIVHGRAYRDRYGTRRCYYQNKTHLAWHVEKELKSYTPKGFSPSQKNIDKMVDWYIKETLEPVWVQTP